MFEYKKHKAGLNEQQCAFINAKKKQTNKKNKQNKTKNESKQN